jgi:Ca2+-binding RTX toxin-like protein
VLTITSVVAATGEVGFSVTHQFATGGIFEVGISVADDDTGIDADQTLAWVTGVRVRDGVLQVIGSSGGDHVTINKQGNGLIKVHADFLQSGNFETFPTADVEQILAYLCEGDDHFTIAGNIDIPAIVHAGAGDDHLNGGRGPAVFLGEDGNDTLLGGSGANILIGGLGTDRLVGGPGGDVLIGGTTDADEDDDALLAILAAWTSDESYDDRVAAVDALLTVIDDEQVDKLTGSAGKDLFYDGLDDVLTDVKKNETVN